MRVLWYISKTKVDAYAGDEHRWTDRVGGHLRLGLPLVSVEAEVAGQPDPDLVRKLERLERRAASDPAVPTASAIGPDPPRLFRFEGRSARIVYDDTFWVAAVDGSAAVLLTGWAGNAIGATPVTPSAISSTEDPMAAVEELARGSVGDRTAVSISDSWATIFRDGTHLLAAAALPRASGLAVYAGWQHADDDAIATSGWTEPIDRVVVGSPIFVEQIAA
jgi:Family of unknown function (DUF7019)